MSFHNEFRCICKHTRWWKHLSNPSNYPVCFHLNVNLKSTLFYFLKSCFCPYCERLIGARLSSNSLRLWNNFPFSTAVLNLFYFSTTILQRHFSPSNQFLTDNPVLQLFLMNFLFQWKYISLQKLHVNVISRWLQNNNSCDCRIFISYWMHQDAHTHTHTLSLK